MLQIDSSACWRLTYTNSLVCGDPPPSSKIKAKTTVTKQPTKHQERQCSDMKENKCTATE